MEINTQNIVENEIELNTKKCSKCDIIKPVEEFYKTCGAKCKLCFKAYYLLRYEQNKGKILTINKNWRDSNKEHISQHSKEYRNKPEIKEKLKTYWKSDEYKNKKKENNKDKTKPYNKEYHAQRYEKNKEKNKEKILAKNKEWRDSHTEYRSLKDKEYRNKPEIKEKIQAYNALRKNTEEYQTNSQLYRDINKDKKSEYDKEYREKNKTILKQKRNANIVVIKAKAKIKYDDNKYDINKKQCERRKDTNPIYLAYKNKLETYLKSKICSKIQAKKYQVEIDSDYLKDLWNKQNGKCYISGIDMTHIANKIRTPTNVSIDQVTAGNGYLKDNVSLCCEFINLSKMQMTVAECKIQLLAAGKNIKDKIYENINRKEEIPKDCEEYLLTLFRNKKIIKTIGKDYIIDLWKNQGGKCAITSVDMTYVKNPDIKYRNSTNISIDKITPELGYTVGNIQLTCLWSNTGKLDNTTESYRNLLLQTYNNINGS
jgi:hypothetical protein